MFFFFDSIDSLTRPGTNPDPTDDFKVARLDFFGGVHFPALSVYHGSIILAKT